MVCVPWLKGSVNLTSSFEFFASDVTLLGSWNGTAMEGACPNVSYTLLSCVAASLTIVPYLRVSSVPKIVLLLLLSTSYTVVMETSGYRQAVG